jgi:alpha-galactosidase
VDWGVDFLKIDNCYYLWDNATFSNPENARFVFAPKIKNVIAEGKKLSAVLDGKLTGACVQIDDNKEYVFGIGTLDGTNTGTSPVGVRSGELVFEVESDCEKIVDLQVEYASGREVGIGEWLQVAVGEGEDAEYFYDDLLPVTADKDTFILSEHIGIRLRAGKNQIRIMNHRRQENTLDSYAAMLFGLNKAKPDHEVVLSMCEWGKTHPQNWAYKVGDSWRILNDITFRVGSDGNPGFGAWFDKGTPSVTSQYNKAVVMDEFAGLDKGWNDPDMLMIGMDGLSLVQNKTHFTMWCMMNSPLMLGLDLRRVNVGDELYKIIANRELIALNQDTLGIQAKRIFTTADCGGESPDKAYIENIDRVDVLAKPLSDGSIALSFINVSEYDWTKPVSVNIEQIEKALGKSYANGKYSVKALWSGETWENDNGVFEITGLAACDNLTIKISSLRA